MGEPTTHLRALNGPAEADRPDRSAETRPLQPACPVTIQRFENGKLSFKDDQIAEEADIRLTVNGQPEAVLARTPGDDLNLVAGYLFSQSRIMCPEDIGTLALSYHGPSRAEVTLREGRTVRRIYPSPRPVHIAPDMLFRLKEIFERRQNLFKNTGCTHAAALFSADGQLIAYGEDVGRHNAFDKALGRALLEGTLEGVTIAMLSSRLAVELAMKATTANIPVLCGFSAATSSAVTYAERNNLSLVGRIRGNSYNVYANGWRFR
ncbi:formate dehydrogenase subunit FdhD [Pseudodesulfovibrio mercurii]|uniref:Protein FdhD n=1 Tax=Pseudodesulfovibrio mercurii TaxID=641491 RepID=F0JEH9_9BACT|nr:formate dehydrogenase accessory sulfurtransferase FdhD [Pseudodesulfovibrio mercurii]EGB13542.1 formate dehydrogenase subunit FdhD [Pseudodesulfovibrio mercurii]